MIADIIYHDDQDEEIELPPTKKSKGLGAILSKVAGSDSGSEPSLTTSGERIDKEMKLYLERPTLDPDSDPFKWWQREEKNY